MSDNRKRSLLIFFLGFIGSYIINHSSLKPKGYSSRTFTHFLLHKVPFYRLVASICTLKFDPRKPKNIGFVADKERQYNKFKNNYHSRLNNMF